MSTLTEHRRISLIWIIPFLAVLLSGWLILREFKTRGPLITVTFHHGSGIEAGKTPLVYKGVIVGLVQDVSLSKDLDQVKVTVELNASARPLAVEGSRFWLVRPEIGLSGVKGLDTLLRGARIAVRAGSGNPTTEFEALADIPMDENLGPGRNFRLQTDSLGSLHSGTAVYFRDIKVGVVEEHSLSNDSTHVIVQIRIFAPYDRLVRPDTRFWNSGGLSMKLGLLSAQVHTNSLESLVKGGVAFATPDDTTGDPVEENTMFLLHDDAEKSWLKWAPALPLVDEVAQSD